MIILGALCCLTAWEKNRLAASTSRRLLEEEIDAAARLIHRAVEVDSRAFDLEVRLIRTPGAAYRYGESTPAFFELEASTASSS